MLEAASDGAGGLGSALVTAAGVVVAAVCALVGVLVSNRRSGSDNGEDLVVNLVGALSDERDLRVAAEIERDTLRAQLDACVDRERQRRR